MIAAPLPVPEVGRPKPIKVPPHVDRTLPNGLRVIAVKRPSVPRVETRLRIPGGLAHDAGDGSRARLLPEVLLGGTRTRSSVEIARELQRLGASLDAAADADDLSVHGGVLTANLGGLLDLMAEVVTAPSLPKDEVAIARDRVAQEIIIARSQPGSIAGEAFRGRIYGRHRYGRGLPKPDAVRRLSPAAIRSFHGARVFPRGSTMVLVGDLVPDAAVERVALAFGRWKGRPKGERVPAPPPPRAGLPALLVDRPGSVQTNIRIGGRAIPRTHPDFFALALANMVFGGYFSSRLVKNIREDKGYTYSPSSLIDHRREASTLVVAAEVGTDVTAPALLEMRYELGRVASVPVGQEELDQARRYLGGATSLVIQTQGGMANYIDGLSAAGLTLDYLRDFRANLEKVTVQDLQAAAMRYMAPRNLLTVLVGDAGTTRGPIEAFDDLEIVPAPS